MQKFKNTPFQNQDTVLAIKTCQCKHNNPINHRLISFAAIIVGFVVGGLSMALTNGGLGTYPVFVASALFVYKIDHNSALAFGWIMWTAQTIMVIIFGGLSFLLLPIYNKYQK